MSVIVGTPSTVEQAMTFNGTTFEATQSFTTTSGANVLCLALVGDISPPDTVTFNGVALTQRRSISDTSAGGVHFYDLDSPSIGTYNIVVRRSGNRTYRYITFQLSGVDTSSPRGNGATSTGVSGTASATVTTTTGQMVIGVASTNNTATADGAQTVMTTNETASGENASSSKKEASSASTTLTWTQTSARWAVAAQAYNSYNPSITSVPSNNTIYANSSNVIVTGTALTTGTSAKLVYANQEISMLNYVANSTQPYFTSPSLANVYASRIQFTDSANLQILNAASGIIASKTVAFLPSPLQKLVHNVTDVSSNTNIGSLYYGQNPAVSVSDQIIYDAKSSLNCNVAVDSQGFFTLDSSNTANNNDSFAYRIYESSLQYWGNEGTITTLVPINARTSSTRVAKSADGKRYSKFPAGNASPGGAWLYEDFSTYTSTANFLTNPRNIYQAGEDLNTQDMSIDTTDGYGGAPQCLRYTFPNRAGICNGYTITRSLALPTTVTELWCEIAVRFSTNWSTVAAGCGGISSPSYKLFFGLINGLNSRFEIVVGNGGVGNDIWVGYPTNEEAVMISTKMTDLVDNNWHVFRCYWKVGAGTGTIKVWFDGSLKADLPGINTGTTTDIYALALGRNINQGPDQIQHIKWGRVSAWNTNPGW